MKTRIALLQDEVARKNSRVNGKQLENVVKLFKESTANYLTIQMSEVELSRHEITNLIKGDTQFEGIMETSKVETR